MRRHPGTIGTMKSRNFMMLDKPVRAAVDSRSGALRSNVWRYCCSSWPARNCFQAMEN